jgi:2-polyprenyl-6-methoxyphenol hydroxylase-like FAD-dependent oxidoreductase
MHTHVAVVGGGIAGASLATVLAARGLDVQVLEATERFDDRVRGESMMPWGVAEAEALGVAEVLRAAGAHMTPVWRRYGEGAEPREIPVGLVVPGVGGTLNLAHPVACQALLDAAVTAGALVVRGVRDVAVEAGDRPIVRYRRGSVEHELRADIVVGADGRGSAVRRSAGIGLQQQEPDGYVSGLLVEGVTGAADHDSISEDDLGLFLLFRQGDDRARAYHVVPPEARARYAGPGGIAQFLRDAATVPSPAGVAMAGARAIGPCATVAGTDTWTDEPCRDGVVLIGDAAGHNDPTAGCGLSIAMRDARMVADLIASGARRASDFRSYAVERAGRLRRLRLAADLVNAASVVPGADRSRRRRAFAAAMASMQAPVFPIVVGLYAGPETIPDDIVRLERDDLLAELVSPARSAARRG